MKIAKIALTAVVLACFGFVYANDVSNDGISASIDTFSGGKIATLHYQPESSNVSSVSFLLDYPKNLQQVDTTSCLADLPEGFFGACRAVDGQVRVIIYSPSNEILPATIIGNVVFNQEVSRNRYESSSTNSLKRADQTISVEDSSFQITNVDKGEVK